MPRIDPVALLNCLNILLTTNGGIKGSHEVRRLVSLMRKFSNKLVSKCCYVLILKETEDELVAEFMAVGGWDMVFQWLGDAIHIGNYPFIREVMSLLVKCPISLDRLKENNCPKIIKGLSKDSEDPGVRELANAVVENWLQFIKSGRAGVDVEVISIPASMVYGSAPSSPDSPSPASADDSEPIPKFKITVRDGKSVLAKVVAEEDAVSEKHRDTVKKSSIDRPVVKKVSEPPKKRDTERKKESESEPKRKSSEVERKKDDSGRSEPRKRDSDGKRRDSDHKDKRLESSSKQSSSSSKSKDKNSSSSSSKRDDQKSHKNEEARKKDKSSSSSSSKSKDSSKDKEKPKEKEEKGEGSDSKAQVDKDKDTLLKIKTPSISSLGKIPRKSNNAATSPTAASSSNVLSSNPVVRPPDSSPLPTARKGSYSDERKRTAELKPSERPKTVKTLPTKFRLTGLEGEVKPPPSRAEVNKKKETAATLPEKRPEATKRASPPPPRKDGPPPEKKSKVLEILAEKKDKILDKPGGIKLIPPKPKPVLLESDMFSDALTASAKQEPRKKKRRVSTGKDAELKKDAAEELASDRSPSAEEHTSSPARESPKSAMSPPRDSKPLKFYRDTLEEGDQDSKKDPKAGPSDAKPDVPEEPRAKYYPEGVLVVARSKRAFKKSVRWRGESELVAIREFELDETERVNVTRGFGDKMTKEKEGLFMRKHGGDEDHVDVKMAWGPLFLVDVPEDKQPPETGKNSEEVNIQYARAKSTLQAIYFSRDMIPDSPAEPDPEVQPMKDPKPIPLDDVTGSTDNVIDFSKSGWPESKPEPVEPLLPIITAVPSICEPVVPVVPPVPQSAPMPPPYGAFPAPGYQGFVAQGPDTWRGPEGAEEMPPPGMGFPQGPVGPMGPPMYGPPPFGHPGAMMPPEAYQMGPMYGGPGFPMGVPPAEMYPQGPGGPPMGGPPMGPPQQNWNRGGPPGGWQGPPGPRPPLNVRNICHGWQRNGQCNRREQCRFLHPGLDCPPMS